ncbi:MAG: hypothetical protein CL928_15725 [Deltaproteobacteria bacterium]|nr:hypothetical protein [Deltaproteobacteria bacterium]
MLLIAVLQGATGCADSAALEGGQALDEATASGQTLLVVGTDPAAMTTDIYLVRALGVGAASAPSIAEANTFGVEAITRSNSATEGLLDPTTERLFSEQLPFAIPDRSGNRLALVISSITQEDEPPLARPALLTLSPRTQLEGPAVPGLFGARFTWLGEYIVLQIADPETGQHRLQVVASDSIDDITSWSDLGPESPSLDVRFQGLLAESNTVLALATDPDTGLSGAYLLDPDTGLQTALTEQVEANVIDAVVSSDGQLLAITTQQLQPETRDITLIDVASGTAHSITDTLNSDCYWPAFAPAQPPPSATQLAFVCQDPDSERPDIVLWSEELAQLDLATESPATPEILTAAPQPAVFDGTMDELVLRSPPQWDPDGQRIVFGASTQAEAYSGDGMTLFALPFDGTAYPIYSGNDTSVGWAHFSSNSDADQLLVWERSETGLDDTNNTPGDYHQPIRVVSTETSMPQVGYVQLGVNLRIGYPLFLGHNSLFYP